MAKKAFTLVEVLIVVLILGILAAIVLPRFSNASAIARASMVADNLRVIRMQIGVYKGQHVGTPPGYPDGDTAQAPTAAAFAAQMTQASNRLGETAPPGTAGYDYGPYLRDVPENPINGKNTVEVLADGAALPANGDNSHGWIYQPATQTIVADSPGTDEKGRRYFDY